MCYVLGLLNTHWRDVKPAMRRAQACLLADVIQHFVDQKLDFDCAYVYEDVQKCIEHIHRQVPAKKCIPNSFTIYMHREKHLTE
jgi:hypothetical protein